MSQKEGVSLPPDVANMFHNALLFCSFFPPTSLFNYVYDIIPCTVNILNNVLKIFVQYKEFKTRQQTYTL
jgi:hypothetical protein